jgi:hypothetical protein
MEFQWIVLGSAWRSKMISHEASGSVINIVFKDRRKSNFILLKKYKVSIHSNSKTVEDFEY